MEVDIMLDRNLIMTNLKANHSDEVLETLSTRLMEAGYVKKEYIDAIKAREKQYPTALPSTAPAIAIPHADFHLVNKTAIAVATLKKPVVFHNMENVAEEIAVQIVIMLAIKEPHGQVEMLQKIVTIIQDEQFRKEMVLMNNTEDLLNAVQTKIL